VHLFFSGVDILKVLLDLHHTIQIACGDHASNNQFTTTTMHEWPANRGLFSNSSSSDSSSGNSSGSSTSLGRSSRNSTSSSSSSSPRALLLRLACYRAAHERLCESGSDLLLWRDCDSMHDCALGCRMRLVVESLNEVRGLVQGRGIRTFCFLQLLPPSSTFAFFLISQHFTPTTLFYAVFK